MKHIVNLLVGIGSVLGAFGSAPAYQKPAPGDRANDFRNMRSDFCSAGTSLSKATNKAKRKHGEINNRAA